MTTHPFLEKLLNGQTVEWKPLGEVCDYEQPSKYLIKSKFYDDSFNTPVLTAGKTFILGYTNEINGIYQASKNSVIIFDDFTTANKWVDFDFKAKSSAMKMITSKDDNQYSLKYIYHWLNTLPNIGKNSDHKRQWISNFTKIKIPIPPLSVQKEIANILDLFSKMWNELANELALRLSQYNYYRDKLLTFDDSVKWVSLGEVTKQTYNIKWANDYENYRYIDLTSVSRENNNIIETTEINALNAPSRARKLIEKDDVIFATTRPTQQRLCLINNTYSGQIASTGYCVLRAKVDKVLPKWIFYYISSTKFKNYVEEHQSGSAYPAISDTKVKEFKIPVPSLEKQQQIVSILDKFDTLTISITEGLPKEIELRQKQYEYYRDLLLTFPKEK